MPRGEKAIPPPKITKNKQAAALPAKKTKVNNDQQELINVQLLMPLGEGADDKK